MNPQEKKVLRELAKKVREISQHPIWDEKIRLWKDKNSLKKVRPLILCSLPDDAWREIIPETQFVSEDPFIRKYEWDLRKRIYRWENIKDDEIINANVYVPTEREITDWIEGRTRPYSGQADRSARFAPSILEYSDFKKLKFPEVEIKRDKTKANLNQLEEIFGDILNVIEGEPFYAATDNDVFGWGNSLIDILCELRGLENVFYDLALEPDFIHDTMEFLMEGTLKYLDVLERENMLSLNNNEFICSSNTPLGSNGLACIDELPGDKFDINNITTSNLWGYFQAQEFSSVSPQMLEEFVLPYQSKIARRFGLNCYGCCEPNDEKWDIIFNGMPNLRELSVSHASDLEIAAEKIKSNYVFSWKPHPSEMIATYDEEFIRREMKKAFETTKECCVIACLRDNQTLFGQPERASKWTEISMEIAMEYTP